MTKMEAAREAINQVFRDTTDAKDETIGNLIDLSEYIEELIDSLKE